MSSFTYANISSVLAVWCQILYRATTIAQCLMSEGGERDCKRRPVEFSVESPVKPSLTYLERTIMRGSLGNLISQRDWSAHFHFITCFF